MYTTTMFNDAARFAGVNAAGYYANAGFIPSNYAGQCAINSNGLNYGLGAPTNIGSGLGVGGIAYNPLLNQTRLAANHLSWNIPQTLTQGQTVVATDNLGQTIVGQVVIDAFGAKLFTAHGVYALSNNPNALPFSHGNGLTPIGCAGTVNLVPQSFIGG